LTVTVPAEYAEIGAPTWWTLEPSWTVHAFVDVVEVAIVCLRALLVGFCRGEDGPARALLEVDGRTARTGGARHVEEQLGVTRGRDDRAVAVCRRSSASWSQEGLMRCR
jgi:hypothetical protein